MRKFWIVLLFLSATILSLADVIDAFKQSNVDKGVYKVQLDVKDKSTYIDTFARIGTGGTGGTDGTNGTNGGGGGVPPVASSLVFSGSILLSNVTTRFNTPYFPANSIIKVAIPASSGTLNVKKYLKGVSNGICESTELIRKQVTPTVATTTSTSTSCMNFDGSGRYWYLTGSGVSTSSWSKGVQGISLAYNANGDGHQQVQLTTGASPQALRFQYSRFESVQIATNFMFSTSYYGVGAREQTISVDMGNRTISVTPMSWTLNSFESKMTVGATASSGKICFVASAPKVTHRTRGSKDVTWTALSYNRCLNYTFK